MLTLALKVFELKFDERASHIYINMCGRVCAMCMHCEQLEQQFRTNYVHSVLLRKLYCIKYNVCFIQNTNNLCNFHQALASTEKYILCIRTSFKMEYIFLSACVCVHCVSMSIYLVHCTISNGIYNQTNFLSHIKPQKCHQLNVYNTTFVLFFLSV